MYLLPIPTVCHGLLGFGVPDPRTGHIVVEMRTPHSAALLKYSCSKRVLALPTVQLNARR